MASEVKDSQILLDPTQTGLMDFSVGSVLTDEGSGGRGRVFGYRHPVTLEVFNSLLTMSLGDFIRRLKLFSSKSLS